MGRFLRNSKAVIISGVCGSVVGFVLTRLYDDLKAKYDRDHYIKAYASVYFPKGKDDENVKKYQEVIDRHMDGIQKDIEKLEEEIAAKDTKKNYRRKG